MGINIIECWLTLKYIEYSSESNYRENSTIGGWVLRSLYNMVFISNFMNNICTHNSPVARPLITRSLRPGWGGCVHELVEKTKPHHPLGRFQNKLGVTGVWVALSRSGRGWLVVVVMRCGWQKSGGQELLQCSCWLKEEGLNKWWNDQ